MNREQSIYKCYLQEGKTKPSRTEQKRNLALEMDTVNISSANRIIRFTARKFSGDPERYLITRLTPHLAPPAPMQIRN